MLLKAKKVFYILAGEIMQRNTLYDGSTDCFKFALADSLSKQCVKEIAKFGCINKPLNRTLQTPIKLAVLTYRDKDDRPGFNHYTNFHVMFRFLFCSETKSYYTGKIFFKSEVFSAFSCFLGR